MDKGARTACLLVAATILVLSPLLADMASAQKPASRLVTTDWLQSNLRKPDLRIIDTRASVKDYWTSHIPGAVYFHPEAMRLADAGVPVKLMPLHALTIMLGRMGVGRETMVVAYAEEGDYKAPYLIWALDYLGHQSAAVLEGGFAKWVSEGRRVTQDYPKIMSRHYPAPPFVHEEVRATLEEVKRALERGSAVLIDVRPPNLYGGMAGPWKRRGHIKGALNRFWGDDLKEDGTWKTMGDLKRAYGELGATPDKLIIVSCGQGQMSAHTYFTLKHLLRYPMVQNYDGSFNEWSNIDELPVVRGMSP